MSAEEGEQVVRYEDREGEKEKIEKDRKIG